MEILTKLLLFRGEVGIRVINLRVIRMDMINNDLGMSVPVGRSPSIDIEGAKEEHTILAFLSVREKL